MEHMSFPAVEVRAEESGRIVAGIAVPYDQLGTGSKGPEMVKPGAFSRTLRNRGPRPLKVFRNHEPGVPVGLVEKLGDDSRGLLVEVRMAETSAGEEALREVRAGLLDSFSIGFTAVREAFVNGVRELREVALHEVSLVGMPAYAGALVTEVRDAPAADLSRYVIPDLPPDVADWC